MKSETSDPDFSDYQPKYRAKKNTKKKKQTFF